MSLTLEPDRSCLGELVDPNVTLKLKPDLPSSKRVNKIDQLDKRLAKKKSLTIDEIKELWTKVKENNASKGKNDRIYLNELLVGWEVNIPSLQIPERNPELDKRLKELRNKLDEKEYERMTRNVDATASTKKNPEDSIGRQIKEMNSALIAAIQFVISLAAAFFFGFSGIQVFVGDLDLAVRLLLGIGSAVIVGIAELYVLVVMLDSSEANAKGETQKTMSTVKKIQ